MVNCYEVWIEGLDQPLHTRQTVYAPSIGKAKSRYFSRLELDGIKFTDIRARKVKYMNKQQLKEFDRVKTDRGIDFAEVGMKVVFQDSEEGIIVGTNNSYLEVFFEKGKFKGKTVNCHPHWMLQYYDKDGRLLYDSNRRV